MSGALKARLAAAKAGGGDAAVADRARRGLIAFVEACAQKGMAGAEIADRLADGTAATQIARVGLAARPEPPGLACARGCAFCCILPGADGGTVTEAEARRLHAALAPLAGQPDGRAWHRAACPALDPATRVCRAYDARPTICRAYVSTDAAACERVSEGVPQPGPGTRGPYHDYLAAMALCRAALKGTRRVSTHALARLAAAAVEGAEAEAALKASRHRPAALDAELGRSRRDLARAPGPGPGLP